MLHEVMYWPFVTGNERLWAGIKAMELKPKQSADLSTQIRSSLHCWLESNSDDEDLEDSADHPGGKNDEDMGDALPSVPFEYLELFTEIRDLFRAPDGLLIRSCYKTLHEAMMIAAEERGERLKRLCFAFASFLLVHCLEGLTLPSMLGAKMLVIGTPGIGKTSWIIYLLWKLANAGKTVLLDLNNIFYLFSRQASDILGAITDWLLLHLQYCKISLCGHPIYLVSC